VRIWLCPSAFFPHRGGVEELTLQLAREYAARGHQVLVVAPKHPADLPSRDTVEGVEVVRIEFASPRRAVRSLARFPRSLARQVAELGRLTPRPDVIHVQCPSLQMAALTAFGCVRRIPLVLTSQGEIVMDENDVYGQSSYLRLALRVSSRLAAGLTACSAWTAEQAGGFAPRFADAMVIPNGIDPSQWQVAAQVDEPVLCAWGRHVPQKGFDLLLPAFEDVRAEQPDARLLLGGSGAQTAALAAAAGPGVELLGPLDRAGVQTMLARSRAAVVPSRLEPFGIVALEAMAVGRPVVWSTVGGLAEATGGIGWGVDPNDRRALATAMLDAVTSTVSPDDARSHAESMSWRTIADQYLGLYETATPRRAAE
jgi:glycogen(starch) synthase